jgi:GH15 family glucan-1,4-alpha-glucosidase
MCWVALDRAAKLAHRLGRPAEGEAWRREAEVILADVIANGFGRGRGVFTRTYGSSDLDATALVLPAVGFLPATDPRLEATADRIAGELSDGGYVRRYLADDGLLGREGAFLLCTFWMANVRSLQGRVDEARALFERAAGAANDVGLLAEQVDPSTGALLGNFPQSFSHLALIRSALLLTKGAARGEGRPASDPDSA